MKTEMKKHFTEDGIKLPYPNPISDHQRSKNVGYAMGWRAAKNASQKLDITEDRIRDEFEKWYDKYFEKGVTTWSAWAACAKWLNLTTINLPTEEIETLREMLQVYHKIYAHGGMNRDQTDEVSKRIKALEAALQLIKERSE